MIYLRKGGLDCDTHLRHLNMPLFFKDLPRSFHKVDPMPILLCVWYKSKTRMLMELSDGTSDCLGKSSI